MKKTTLPQNLAQQQILYLLTHKATDPEFSKDQISTFYESIAQPFRNGTLSGQFVGPCNIIVHRVSVRRTLSGHWSVSQSQRSHRPSVES